MQAPQNYLDSPSTGNVPTGFGILVVVLPGYIHEKDHTGNTQKAASRRPSASESDKDYI